MFDQTPPILISCYNRPDKLYACLQSIAKCTNLNNRIIYITSDAAAVEEDKPLVEKNRNIIDDFNNILNIVSFTSSINTKGEIIQSTVLKIFKTHPYLIACEEDNLFSEDYLNYMDYHLKKNLDNDSIFSICAYSFLRTKNSYEPFQNYLSQFHNAWGSGYYANRWSEFLTATSDINRYIENYLFDIPSVLKRQKIAPHFLRNILSTYIKGKTHRDILISIYMYQNKKFSIFPSQSLVKNTGHDNSGVNNKKKTNKYIVNIYKSKETKELYRIPIIDEEKKAEIRKFFSKNRVALLLDYCVYFIVWIFIFMKLLSRNFYDFFHRLGAK